MLLTKEECLGNTHIILLLCQKKYIKVLYISIKPHLHMKWPKKMKWMPTKYPAPAGPSVVSCEVRDDLIVRMPCHIRYTWMACHRCVCDNGVSVHRIVRIATSSRSTGRHKVSLLQNDNTQQMSVFSPNEEQHTIRMGLTESLCWSIFLSKILQVTKFQRTFHKLITCTLKTHVTSSLLYPI